MIAFFMPHVNNQHLLGIFLGFLGYTVWVLGDTSTKLAGDALVIPQLLCVNILASLLPVIIQAAWRGDWRRSRPKQWKIQALRCLCSIVWGYAGVIGLTLLSLPYFYIIIFSSPFLMAVLGRFVLHEAVSMRGWLAIMTGLAGVVMVALLSAENTHAGSFWGVVLTSVAALGVASTMVLSRLSKQESVFVLTFWPIVVRLIVACLWLLFVSHPLTWPLEAVAWATLSGILSGVGAMLNNAALRLAPVAMVAPYHYTQILTGTFVAWLLWDQKPDRVMLLGAALIIFSGLFMLREAQQKKHQLTG